jgi:hypothetical protein
VDTPASLQTIAEVGIGLAGFSGLVVALRKDSGPLDDVRKFRLRLLLLLAFGAIFLSFLPELLSNMAVPAERIWFDASAALFVYSIILMWWWFSRSRVLAKQVPEIFNWYAFTTMSVGHVIVLVSQLGVMLGVFEARASGLFTLGLIWYLIHAAQQFMRMLFIQPRE